MTEALSPLTRRRSIAMPLLVLLAGVVAILFGVSAGNPHPLSTLFLIAMLGLAVAFWIVHRPYHGYLILSGSVTFLCVYAISVDRYLNIFDIFLPLLGVVTFFGSARREARAEDARLVGPEHDAIRKQTRSFAKNGVLFYVLALVTLVKLAIAVGPNEALQLLMILARSVEGALMFPLSLWWLRSEKRIHHVIGAVMVAFGAFAVVNVIQVLVSGTYRAGLTWIVNQPTWPVEAANEAGFTMLFVWVMLLTRHQVKPSLLTFPLMGITLFLLFLTQSRSGLLALVLFTALTLRRIRWQYIVALAILVPLALAFVPEDFFRRMAYSATMRRGTFEVYSIMIRVYGYQSAIRAFMEHWMFGVGFFGLIYYSHLYNDLHIVDLGAENIFLETATGMGILGLLLLLAFFWRSFRLGWTIKRLSPPGSLAHVMGSFNFPYMIAIAFANMFGDSLVGLVGLGQVIVWTAMLVRAGHLAVERKRVAAGLATASAWSAPAGGPPPGGPSR